MFFTNAISLGTSPRSSLPKSKSQQTVAYDVFKEHWRQVLTIFNKSLVNDDDIQIVKNNLGQMIALLIDELNQVTNAALVGRVTAAPEDTDAASTSVSTDVKFSGPLWDYLLATNIFETVYLWSLSYPEYLYDLKYEQLRNYEELIAQMQTNEQTNLLLYRQLHRPLFSLLNHCATHNSELIERYMISILNQLCVCMCKNANLLNIFFDYTASSSGQSSVFVNETSNELILERSANERLARSGHPHSKSFIFTLLIPYIHKEGSLGQQARDALLMIMQLSSRNQNLAKYIVYSTDFCPILATGLSGLYSELPQKITQTENFDEIRYLHKEDIIRIHSLNKFINSLEFCNNVIQVSHSLIANQLLQYVYFGFLVPVIAPALTQDVADKFPVELVQLENYTNCMDEIVSATLYLDLFLRTINEPNLLRIFLKFVLFSKFDERMTLLDTLINRINSSTKLSLATLMLFHTMIDLNSEDVIYKLILSYLLPCKHLMKSQLVSLKQSSAEINGLNAQAFLSLSTSFITNSDSSPSSSDPNTSHLVIQNYSALDEASPVYRWLNTFLEGGELDTTLSYLDTIRFNYVDYLKDAKAGIMNTAEKTAKWSLVYDVSAAVLNSNPQQPTSSEEIGSSEAPQRRTTINTCSSKSPSGAQLVHPHLASTDLEADAEEFFFHLNISSSGNVFNETKSGRSTINIFGREPSSNTTGLDSDSILGDMDTHSMTSEKIKRRSSHRKSGKNRGGGGKSRAEATNNDFYILSFDNEISESDSEEDERPASPDSSSRSSSTCSLDRLAATTTTPKADDDTTSLVSSQTVNNELELDRQNLVDFLFSNEDNNKLYLNSNLTNFLSGLESYFSEKSTSPEHQPKRVVKKSKNKNLEQMCLDICKLYDELIVSSSGGAVPSCSVASPPVMTEFPKYDETGESSTCSPSQQATATGDSGVDMTTVGTSCSSSSSQDDVGPFLHALLNRLEHLLSNSLQINFLVTGILARLAFYPQLLLRSFLLNNSLVLQPNIKSLLQVLGNVKYKIDACSRTYNNFSLLYLRAKVSLVKRLVDHSHRLRSSTSSQRLSPSSSGQLASSSSSTPPNGKKKFTVDRFLSIFFKPDSKESRSSSSPVSAAQRQPPPPLLQPNVEFSSTIAETSEMINMDDFFLADSEWEDVRTRNIAFSAVIFDEFVKELAAICQEHSVLSHEVFN